MVTAAAFVAFLMAAVKAFSVMMTTFVPFAAVMSAFMALAMMMPAIMPFTVMMIVVVASGVGIIRERPFCQCLGSSVRRARHASVEANTGLSQSGLCSHADPAADQGVCLRGFQETGQCAVAAAVGGHDLFSDNLAVLYVI